MTQKIKSTLIRFLKVFCISGLSTMATLAAFSGTTWKEMGLWLGALAFSFISGGIAGVVAGYEKWVNWTD